MSSLTQQLILQAKVEALELLVRRLIVDQVVRCNDPRRALDRLKRAADDLGDDADHERQTRLLASGKRAITAADALKAIVIQIGVDAREELREMERPAA
jgi:hypothetical protein